MSDGENLLAPFAPVAVTSTVAPSAAGDHSARASVTAADVNVPLDTVPTDRRRRAGNLRLKTFASAGRRCYVGIAPCLALDRRPGVTRTPIVQVVKGTDSMLSTRRKVSLIALCGAVAVLVPAVVQTASATHVRPKGATPLRAAFVPSYEMCVNANRTHAAP